ncbi:emp24/gp25L/p24 family/GOLD-domain-containing protein [Phakopsora pachyrhizi]|uniref:Emp24/gp25L/p24 family/GOLD-domain-containing protein n=2 Tax=Phakopsora pachyrhizi TaxID=170000 RepID=A0AAV0BDP0_PHAPC|nr:emp24/gp25L/p24 family/GOLD-domain-containing protein [Phakopsora pachyrhizi]CAH7683193.1 emp24/gp25L/p24 family/GOLD-domain-containing protein [Phakopsora pachyrhizi]CAH7684570.1 emp24/gp25L/p24 family/GOLD-domain-containing protein [Phakopsora pachyrhizi]
MTNNLRCLKSFLTSQGNFLILLIWCYFQSVQVDGTSLTTTIGAGERLCFYAWVDKPLEKVGFYFAVQSGGSFDIDWTITDTKDNIIIEGEKDRQGDYIFTADSVGEYSFCFSNDMSSFSEKIVDFDITVENEPRPTAAAKPSGFSQQTSSLEESIYKLNGYLSNIQRTQKYFRTRENRNYSTVKTTRNRVFWFNIGCSLLLIGMSFTQVFIVRKFFNSPGKYVRV